MGSRGAGGAANESQLWRKRQELEFLRLLIKLS
jgi:hypothetical protein